MITAHIDKTIHVTYISPSVYRILGNPEGEFAGLEDEIWDIIASEDRQSVEKMLRYVAETGEVGEVAFRIKSRKTWHHLRISVLPEQEVEGVALIGVGDLSLYRIHFQRSRVQWCCALHQSIRRLALCLVM